MVLPGLLVERVVLINEVNVGDVFFNEDRDIREIVVGKEPRDEEGYVLFRLLSSETGNVVTEKHHWADKLVDIWTIIKC